MLRDECLGHLSLKWIFSSIVLDDMGVPVLRSSPCVGGWIMHPLSGTDAVNGLAWTRESPMLDENPDGWMFKMFR